MKYKVVKMQSTRRAHQNRVYISNEFRGTYCALNGVAFRAERCSTLLPYTLSLSQVQRDATRLGLDAEVDAQEIQVPAKSMVVLVVLKISSVTKVGEEINQGLLTRKFLEVMEGVPVNIGQKLYLFVEEGKEMLFIAQVEYFDTLDGAQVGVITEQTKVEMKSETITLVGKSTQPALSYDFDFREMGIGGLQKEFEHIFRRAFIQRTYPPEFIKKLGIRYIKGIMLYGPPGTGKTLIARMISSFLNPVTRKIVNGPDILNKYVGQSEENIRKLFEDAENDKSGTGVHIIIFDEIDAICKSRGSTGGVTDQVLTQILTKMDGVKSLDNILVIAMTNRIDLIDEALLRPGRFEIQIEIGLPDEAGRLEILKIHTGRMSKNCLLSPDIDMEEVARKARNYTGAELTAIVNSASSFALIRAKKNGEEVLLTMNDFNWAIDEIRPAFGVSRGLAIPEEVYVYPSAEKVLNLGSLMVERIRATPEGRKNERASLGLEEGVERIAIAESAEKKRREGKTLSLLLFGEGGTGKSALASIIALDSGIPFVRVVSPRDLVGYNEYEKINFIKKTFEDAYKSNESLVILDDLESLIEYVSIGPRFSNAILQALKIFIRNRDVNRVLAVGTTRNIELMEEMDLLGVFDEQRMVERLGAEDVEWFRKNHREIHSEEGDTIREVVQ
jgi:vesicle-fusing ATPase